MKVTAILKDTTKYEVMEHCFMGVEYEQVGDDVTILYYDKYIALDDLKGWKGEYEIERGWNMIDIWDFINGKC